MTHDLPTFDPTSQHYPFLCSTEELSLLTRMFMRICTIDPPVPQRRLLIPIIGWRSLVFARLASPGPFAVDGELILTPAVHVQTTDGRHADWLDTHAVPEGLSVWGASAQEALAEVKPTHVALVGTNEEVQQAYVSMRHLFTKGLSLHVYRYNDCADARHLDKATDVECIRLVHKMEKDLQGTSYREYRELHYSLLRYALSFAEGAPSRFAIFPQRLQMSLAHRGGPVSFAGAYRLSQPQGFRKTLTEMAGVLVAATEATVTQETRKMVLDSLQYVLGTYTSFDSEEAFRAACRNLCDPAYLLEQYTQLPAKKVASNIVCYATQLGHLPAERLPLWLLP